MNLRVIFCFPPLKSVQDHLPSPEISFPDCVILWIALLIFSRISAPSWKEEPLVVSLVLYAIIEWDVSHQLKVRFLHWWLEDINCQCWFTSTIPISSEPSSIRALYRKWFFTCVLESGIPLLLINPVCRQSVLFSLTFSPLHSQPCFSVLAKKGTSMLWREIFVFVETPEGFSPPSRWMFVGLTAPLQDSLEPRGSAHSY